MTIADTPYYDTLKLQLIRSVQFALEEDIGSGDITAELIPEHQQAKATLITREPGILCGREWVDEVFRQLDPKIQLVWHKADGDRLEANDCLLTLSGPARSLLTGERTALNFLQTLSGTATAAGHLADSVKGTGMTILDTRKTLPGLRLAQKYATWIGGCQNHRLGLYDQFLIKENHIAACGGIAAAIATARNLHPEKTVEVEVENFEELDQALSAGADIIMLDNFTPDQTIEALKHARGKAKLESSGNLDLSQIQQMDPAALPDYASVGAITKHIQALDLSLRLDIEASTAN
ncbi:MAG: carboxylating nicotinate-nucleotide diphosphorylase [Saccharospirillum sp.]|nr:carboxylating nicotinate-nucleotide diphosphorylase [Saccharospirillum sp.]